MPFSVKAKFYCFALVVTVGFVLLVVQSMPVYPIWQKGPNMVKTQIRGPRKEEEKKEEREQKRKGGKEA